MADATQPNPKQPQKTHRYRLSLGRPLTDDELKQLQSFAPDLEVRRSAQDGDHEHHSDHSGPEHDPGNGPV